MALLPVPSWLTVADCAAPVWLTKLVLAAPVCVTVEPVIALVAFWNTVAVLPPPGLSWVTEAVVSSVVSWVMVA